MLAIVNLDETPYDGDAELVVRGRTAVVLADVARILARESGSQSPVVL
jgi:hypothetical protein